MENIVKKIVNDRALVLGLDYLYRESMKLFETNNLLPKSRELLNELSLTASNVPIESYYNESDELKEYFLTMRTLQGCPIERTQEVEHLEAYQLLSKVTSSAIFGSASSGLTLLSRRFDSLYFALKGIPVDTWSIDTITAKAHSISTESDDISLVGIAAFINDPVVLTALKESVALYSEVLAGCAMVKTKIVYEWHVDAALQNKVNRFIKTFNELSSSNIKEACSENTSYFYNAFKDNDIVGRCVYIGYDDSKDPTEKYHWAVKYETGKIIAEDFWSDELWTTERYKNDIAV